MKITPFSREAYQLFHEGALALSKIESNGIRLDLEYCKTTMEQLKQKIERIRDQIKADPLILQYEKETDSTFNPNSGKQISYILFKMLGLKPVKLTPTEQPSTDYDTLTSYDVPLAALIIQLRKTEKILSTYLMNLVAEAPDGWLHPFFHLNTVTTYRSSSSSPNFQNIPIRDPDFGPLVRKCFIPRPGHLLLEADFSGIEVAIAACYHKDSNMLKYITDTDSDMHRDVAVMCFMLARELVDKKIRFGAKNSFTFAEFYGDYYKNTANGLWTYCQKQKIQVAGVGSMFDHLRTKGIRSLEDFTEHIKKVENWFWYEKFPEYTQWKQDWLDAYHDRGYFISKTGFRCQGIMRKNEVINFPIQGSAFHCLLWSLIQVERIMSLRKMRSRIIGQIHDSILIDVHQAELESIVALLRRVLTVELPRVWKWIIVPLRIEIETTPVNGSWADKKLLEE